MPTAQIQYVFIDKSIWIYLFDQTFFHKAINNKQRTQIYNTQLQYIDYFFTEKFLNNYYFPSV